MITSLLDVLDSTVSRGPFFRTRDNNFRSGFFFGLFARRMYLETFLRGGKRIRSGKFFYGQKTDVTSKNPWDPKFDENSKLLKPKTTYTIGKLSKNDIEDF